MDCIFCKNKTIIKSKYLYDCKNCSKIDFKNKKQFHVYFYVYDNKTYDIMELTILDQDKENTKQITLRYQNNETFIINNNEMMTIKNIIDLTPDNFQKTFKYYTETFLIR